MLLCSERHDKCGVFGIYGNRLAADITRMGLFALQHRGQESAGIVSTDGNRLYDKVGMGLVSEVFGQTVPSTLKGRSAIGHVRYSTSGASHITNAQPFVRDTRHGWMAICHNGNFTNTRELKAKLKDCGAVFTATSDTELVLHCYSRSRAATIERAFIQAVRKLEGGFSLLALTPNKLIAIRDKHGIRPLVLGKKGRNGCWVVASETCAISAVHAQFVDDVEQGEMLVIDESGLSRYYPFRPSFKAECVFEDIYFTHPDSRIGGRNVADIRESIGARLALEHPVDADCVVPVLNSGIYGAVGYARKSGIPLELNLIRNQYIGRSFILPNQLSRETAAKAKLRPLPMKRRRVILVDDSIVRGTTSREIVQMVRQAGASEIHVRITSPPILWPCFYGVDMPNRDELIAANKSLDQITKYLGADSLGYVSYQGLLESVPNGNKRCSACFTGVYPTETELDDQLIQFGG